MGIIACLTISICILIVCIAKRPHYIDTTVQEPAIITEVPMSESLIETTSSVADNSDENAIVEMSSEESIPTVQHGKTSTEVNIRDAANPEARVLATVDGGTAFEIIEIQKDGWVKIKYKDMDAYISSAYVILTD